MLLIPQCFSRVGRYTITCYALVLILTGPATNTLKNSEVLSESMACGQVRLIDNDVFICAELLVNVFLFDMLAMDCKIVCTVIYAYTPLSWSRISSMKRVEAMYHAVTMWIGDFILYPISRIFTALQDRRKANVAPNWCNNNVTIIFSTSSGKPVKLLLF